MTKLVGILLAISVAILAAVFVGFFTVRRYIQKSMLNKYVDQ